MCVESMTAVSQHNLLHGNINTKIRKELKQENLSVDETHNMLRFKNLHTYYSTTDRFSLFNL